MGLGLPLQNVLSWCNRVNKMQFFQKTKWLLPSSRLKSLLKNKQATHFSAFKVDSTNTLLLNTIKPLLQIKQAAYFSTLKSKVHIHFC